MAKLCLSTFVATLLFSFSADAFDDLRSKWNIDFLYHYVRQERATINSNVNFLSRNGGMLQVEFTDKLGLFWRYYFSGDLAYAIYEAPGSVQIRPRDYLPWQINGGIALQVGSLKNLELFAGIGGASEFYNRLVAVDSYTIETALAARAHLGFSYRFISIVGTTARIYARYSLPVTAVDHSGENISFAGILDGTLRLKFNYDSSWSLYGGIRFEDYETVSQSVTYFNTRIYAGIGIQL